MRFHLEKNNLTAAVSQSLSEDIQVASENAVNARIAEIKAEFSIDGMEISDKFAELVDWLLLRQAIKDQRRYARAAEKSGDKVIGGKIRQMRTLGMINWRALPLTDKD